MDIGTSEFGRRLTSQPALRFISNLNAKDVLCFAPPISVQTSARAGGPSILRGFTGLSHQSWTLTPSYERARRIPPMGMGCRERRLPPAVSGPATADVFANACRLGRRETAFYRWRSALTKGVCLRPSGPAPFGEPDACPVPGSTALRVSPPAHLFRLARLSCPDFRPDLSAGRTARAARRRWPP